MLGQDNDIGLNSHIQMAAHTMFPYYMKTPERPKRDTMAGPRLARPFRNKEPLYDDAKENSASGENSHAGHMKHSYIIPPTKPCLPFTAWTVIPQVYFNEQPDAEEGAFWLRQPDVDRMPSVDLNPQPSGNPKIWTAKKRNAAIEEEEARLLGNNGTNDAGAIRIGKPTTRTMNPQAKIPGSGFRARNTLATSPNLPGSYSNQTAGASLRGGRSNSLQLEISRGINVRVMSYATGAPGELSLPPSKRQKTNHQASSPSSSGSVDELLDRMNPNLVSFSHSQRSSQALSSHSLNSQGSGMQVQKNGSVNGLTEHRNLERMMDSKVPTRKQRQRNDSQRQKLKNRSQSSPEISSLSNPIDISGADEVENVDLKTTGAERPMWQGTARKPPSTTNVPKTNSSKSILGQSTGTRSPYFDEAALPAPQTNGTRSKDHTQSGMQKGNSKLPEKLADQFVPTNGVRRCSDVNMSSDMDELQLGTTVGHHPDKNALSSINRPRKSSPSKALSSSLHPTSHTEEDEGLDPSIIRPSVFTAAKSKAQSEARLLGGKVREKKAPWAIDVVAVSYSGTFVNDEGMGFVYDDSNDCYVVMRDGRPTKIQVQVQKLLKILWPDSGCKLRFTSSKVGTFDNVVDLEFRNEKDVAKLVGRLVFESGCKTVQCSKYLPSSLNRAGVRQADRHYREQIEKAFEKRRSEMQKNMDLAQDDLLDDAQQASSCRPLGEASYGKRPSDTGNSRGQRPQRSVVGDLLARAGLEDEMSVRQRNTKSMTNGLPRDENISNVLERLKPHHNRHLRHSARASGTSDSASKDVFEEHDDIPVETRYSKVHGLGDPWKKPLTYPKVGKKKTTVEWSDLERLDEGEFLNDNLISFYLRFLEQTLEEKKPDLAKRVYFFNTFFFATLMNTHKGKKGFNYEGVQKWTRNVDLFTYDYIVVPINESTHWYLAIICNLPALDRGVDLSDVDSSSPIQFGPATTPGKSDELVPPLSSPTDQLAEGDSITLVGVEREADERGARSSFAEMSLDAPRPQPTTDDADSKNDRRPKSLGPTSEDQEMLDVQLQETTLEHPRPHTADEKTKESVDASDNPIEDTDQGRKAVAKFKKNKRKSVPAVTKTPPDKPLIITFDSLGLPRSPTIRILKDYLREEAKAKRGGMEFDAGQIKGITAAKIPQQDNFSDCGVFLLGYVAKFLEVDPQDFIANIIGRRYDVSKDWPLLKPSQMRASIREQVMHLQADQASERQRDRSAQKAETQDIKGHQQLESSPTRATGQAEFFQPEFREEKDGEAEKSAEILTPEQPQTRKGALESASRIEPSVFDRNLKAILQRQANDSGDEDIFQTNDQKIRKQENKIRSPKTRTPGREKRGNSMQGVSPEEPSIILVESQSQLGASAPRSFHDAQSEGVTQHLHVAERGSPELLAEIQDSQPSQTSRAFADAVRRASDVVENPAAEQTTAVMEVPLVVLPENEGQSKRRKTGHGLAAVPTQRAGWQVEAPNWSLAAREGRSTRKKLGRKAGKEDEIISIDD